MRKINWNKTFMLDDQYSISCGWQNTGYGFRHLAILRTGFCELSKSKACYYNRTWEAYEYQSVVHSVIRKYFDDDQARRYCDKVDGKSHEEISSKFGMIAGIAKLGEILCNTKEEKNSWKMRMLKAGIQGIDPPEDWDNLPEDEKERRLNGAIEALR